MMSVKIDLEKCSSMIKEAIKKCLDQNLTLYAKHLFIAKENVDAVLNDYNNKDKR